MEDREIWGRILQAERDVEQFAAKPRKKKKEPPHSEHWASPVLLERAAYLRKMAKVGDGQASETLKEYPQHATMLSFRARDGEAELHENFADIFFVLDGRATLVSGGIVVEPRTVGAGEVRGTSIDGGVQKELRAGDVVHVPAGVPHQMLVRGDKTFTSFVVKIAQTLPE
jgi:mannose-6-phosphate isomerase-like protein (cupin superfamily)